MLAEGHRLVCDLIEGGLSPTLVIVSPEVSQPLATVPEPTGRAPVVALRVSRTSSGTQKQRRQLHKQRASKTALCA